MAHASRAEHLPTILSAQLAQGHDVDIDEADHTRLQSIQKTLLVGACTVGVNQDVYQCIAWPTGR